ncbi:S1 RNA-binding domain-containing protein [Eubacterium xylanophilum]|uniref:S1 RNA-binding domain-containing protein n=1 Tax=Eubacterium xylanophilum TaxID=39497 RepID=UPI0004B3695F|nr:S1 RNA-binding domain-containing protein [Eubacterium xylanophilum]
MSEERIESMADYEDAINASFKRLREGDIVKGTVVSVEEDEVLIDLHTFSQGVIPSDEYSDDPDFHAMDEIAVGQELDVMVLYEDDQGRTVTSLREANRSNGWEALRNAMDSHRRCKTRIKEVVPSGVVAYVEGIRGFIPASKLDLNYVEEEDLKNFLGKNVEVYPITIDEEGDKLILSVKDVLREEAAKEHEVKLSALQKGFITTGKVSRIEPYGCFVDIGDDLTGLVHISQIANKFIKSPKEVVKLGMEVKVKVLDVEEGKIRLSMKQAEMDGSELDQKEDDSEKIESKLEYHDDEEATTTLGSLLAGIKIDE